MYKRIVCLLAAAVFFMTGLKASAGYYYDRRGRSVAAPDTYVAGGLLDGNALGIGSFDAIGDLYVDGEEALYIADTGNDRVVVLSADDTVRRVVETVETDEGPVPLNAPEGVFYHNGLLYICNTGGGEVLAVDADNRVVRRLGKPESASLSEEAVFKPSKVAVNASGAVFVAASGIYLGLLQYGTDDVFANFFGAAKVEVTPDVVLAAMWKSLFTDAQRESLKREISTEYANLFIDSEDFVFTVTSTVNEKQVSRLNAAGENILKYPGYDDASLFTSGYNRNNFGDQEFDYSKGYKIVSQLTDLHVDAEGILTVLDSRRGKVLQFDSELNPIGVFGGTGDQRGFFRGAAALEKQGEAYLIADGDKKHHYPHGAHRIYPHGAGGAGRLPARRICPLGGAVERGACLQPALYRRLSQHRPRPAGRWRLPGGDGIPAGGRRPVLLFARPAGIPPGFHPEQPTLAAARHARRPGGAGCGLAPLETMAAILMSHERRGSHVQPVQIPAAEL